MRYAVAFNPENLMSLCKECHAELHKKGTTHGLNLDSGGAQRGKSG